MHVLVKSIIDDFEDVIKHYEERMPMDKFTVIMILNENYKRKILIWTTGKHFVERE